MPWDLVHKLLTESDDLDEAKDDKHIIFNPYFQNELNYLD